MNTRKLCSLSAGSRDFFYTSLSNALSSVTNQRNLRRIHSLIITLGLHNSVLFSGKLISKYSQFKDPLASLSIFGQSSHKKNVYLWNTIIRAMTHNGLYSTALDFYTQMRELRIVPDNYTLPSVINSCANLLDFETAKLVHDHVLEVGFGSDLYICNALIDMYSRLNNLDRARNVFDGMSKRDLITWNSLISGYSSNGYRDEALEFFYKLRMVGLLPDCFTVSSVLPACSGLMEVVEGQLIHGLVEKIGVMRDVIVSNGLLSMYFKFDKLVDCEKVFNKMDVRDTVTWNTMICGFFNSSLYDESIRLFFQMVHDFEPDKITLSSVLQACGHVRDLKSGRSVHDYMVKNRYTGDITANNLLINMYTKCGELLASREVFDSMKSRDLVSWNSMISGYAENEFYEEAIELFNMMKMELEPDSITYVILLTLCTQSTNRYFATQLHCTLLKQGFDSIITVGNSLIDMYAKVGELDNSLEQFENMEARDVVTWNTIIAACGHCEDCSLGLRMISRMRNKGITFEVPTLLSTLTLCSFLGAKRQAKELHGCIFRLGFESDVSIGNAVIEMYSKSGILWYSMRVFKLMKTKDVISWTALISAYGMYGEGMKALKVFQKMKKVGIVPDHVVFVAILFACSHSGLVQEGWDCFYQMKNDYSIEPRKEHYACMVDLLSRSGLLAEAEDFILSMPQKPDASIWGALLSACRSSGDIKIAERVSKRLLELNSDDPGYHVLASNVYAALGKWDKVKMIRKSLRARGLKKQPGFSWLEIQNRVYIFGTGHRFFEQCKEVHDFLFVLSDLMAKEGYVADLRFALHDVEDDEKVEMLCGHSERLAIAFGVLNTEPGSPLQIMKNLRVCGDCHTATKYISKILQRVILVRDANRFHLFKDGTCSCGDHW
ncbi:pentatricopeptide repeat-containing protein At3g03580-like [Coffea eugenioides]|uniref:pentatricopeptide repeat-containing protein At3g03580-like n=1 Tax=Coffea eugenioides TaxID=49369 RepID=UPI000F612BB8|nr:pentatricopeptide repeat-containing protein At3g03580-like [Coffea eugenioides]XP_027183617.1 pentatricopeptide repeat-containing protein At3g03580-like [Coffea eugenioides]